MAQDEQDEAEAFDEDMIDGDDLTADRTHVDFPPDQLRGVPYGDADVTDESFADRARQEEPEVMPRDIDVRDADGLADNAVDVDDLDDLDGSDVPVDEADIRAYLRELD